MNPLHRMDMPASSFMATHFNTAGSIEVYQEESHVHNMANKDESELVPSSSKGSHLEPVSAAVKALKDHEDKLVDLLEDTDLVRLARFGSEGGFISQDVKKNLESMDPNVHWPTKIRYLFLHVYKSLQSNPRLYERWLKLLSKHGASSEALEQVRLSYALEQARLSSEEYCARESVSGGVNAGVVVGTKRPHKCDYFSEEHVPVLTEILANHCRKWNEIGTSLNLSDSVLHNIVVKMNLHGLGLVIFLKEVLQEWIIGNHEHAKPPTVESLEETLRSKIVGLGSEANELQENLRKHGVCLTGEPSLKRPRLDNTSMEILSQTRNFEVNEEKSALLEVQVTTSHDTTITYQWMKDSAPLNDNSTYCGTRKQILCINDVTMASEGTYHCEIQTHENEKFVSDPIKLTVIKRVKVLRYYEDELATSLKSLEDADLMSFAKEASETGFIPQMIKNSFDSLDSNVSCSLKIRYLFMNAYERIDNNSSILCEKWLNLLSEFGVTDDLLGQVRHCPMKRPCLEVTPMEIVRQTYDLKVNEEKSTLLEVQISTSQDTTITYQWMKDGAPLNDNSTYCGTHKRILCINSVTMTSEGTYFCEIQNHDYKKLVSDPIKLTVIKRVEVLRYYEDELVTSLKSLKDADLMSFAKVALETGFIPQMIKNSFDFFDSNVPYSLKIRFLFMYAYERIDNNSSIHYEKWLNLLSQFGATDDLLGQVRHSPMKRPCLQVTPMEIVRQTHDLKVNEEKSTLLEVQLSTSQDTTITYQWMKGGAPLNNNPTYCGTCKQILCINSVTMTSEGTYHCEIQTHKYKKLVSDPIKLTVIKRVKILKDYEDELVTSLKSLKDADLMSFAKEALETGFIPQMIKNSFDSNVPCSLKIRYLFMNAYETIDNDSSIQYEKWLNLLSQFGVADGLLGQVRHGPIKQPCLHVTPMKIVRQTHDLKVNEEKSTLLEVQVTTSHDTTITYQWMKDGAPLNDNSTYCGTHKQILCINDVTMASEGTYHCEIQTRENEKLQSEPIKLIVKVSPEKKVLIDMYLSQPEVPKDTWPPVSNNTYINLALIKPGAIDKAGEYAYNTIQGDVDDILKDKDRIEYEEVFSNLVSGTRLLIEGRPGSGKTTLVHKFSQDWASGKLNLKNIRLLFLVHLRVLLNNPSIQLRDILKYYYEDQIELDQISEQFSGEGLCFVLDGLDEYSPKGKKNTTIFKLINKELLPKSIVVVASRPAAVVHLKSVATKRVEVLGFQKQQISQYIKEYKFSNVEKIQNLESYLEQHPNVHHMCYLPIHASMVCYLFNLMGTALARTETEMYTSFMIHTLLRTVMRCDENERYLQSPDDLPEVERGIFFQICKLAFEKTVSSKQVMKRSEIKHFFKDVSCGKESLGLITVDCIAAKFGFQDLYTFLHLTFQEYLAAYHITKLGEEEQTKIIEKYGKKKHMHVVWKFHCGLIDFENDTKKFEKLVKCSESPDDLFHIQCAFESQKSIVCDSVIRSGEEGSLTLKSHFLTPSDLTAIGFVVSTASESHPVKKLVLNRCTLGEEGISAFFQEAGDRVMSIHTLSYHGGNCNMAQLKLVNILLGKMSALETLDISDTKLGPKKVQALTSNITLPNFETLVVGDYAFLKSLKFNSPKVRSVKLNLNYKFIGDDGVKALAEGLKHCTNLQTLHLNWNRIGADGAKALAEGLKHYTNLQTLDLYSNSIGDDGAKALAEGLKHYTNLQMLNLQSDSIGDDGAKALAEGLKHCTNLQKLDLSSNSIGDDGAKALAEGLKHCTNLQKLDLSSNSIGDDGAKALAEGLKHCKNLQKLDLSSNSIGDDGAKALAEGLKHCTNLQTLYLWNNSIGDDGAKALAEGLKHCTNLQTLYLWNNSIGDDGAKALADHLQHVKNLSYYF